MSLPCTRCGGYGADRNGGLFGEPCLDPYHAEFHAGVEAERVIDYGGGRVRTHEEACREGGPEDGYEVRDPTDACGLDGAQDELP